MKHLIIGLFVLFAYHLSAQQIILSEANTYFENNDNRLYRIITDSSATYLGKIEINGSLQNDVEAFQTFYKKAKTIGANAYIYNPPLNLEGEPVDTPHKQINLYYTPNPIQEENVFSVFNSTKEMTMIINGDKMTMPKRTYITKKIEIKENNYIATRHLLGSRINLYYKMSQPKQNYQIISGRLSSDKSGVTGGLIFKSGDIILLENSYADFLTLFYQRLN